MQYTSDKSDVPLCPECNSFISFYPYFPASCQERIHCASYWNHWLTGYHFYISLTNCLICFGKFLSSFLKKRYHGHNRIKLRTMSSILPRARKYKKKYEKQALTTMEGVLGVFPPLYDFRLLA